MPRYMIVNRLFLRIHLKDFVYITKHTSKTTLVQMVLSFKIRCIEDIKLLGALFGEEYLYLVYADVRTGLSSVLQPNRYS